MVTVPEAVPETGTVTMSAKSHPGRRGLFPPRSVVGGGLVVPLPTPKTRYHRPRHRARLCQEDDSLPPGLSVALPTTRRLRDRVRVRRYGRRRGAPGSRPAWMSAPRCRGHRVRFQGRFLVRHCRRHRARMSAPHSRRLRVRVHRRFRHRVRVHCRFSRRPPLRTVPSRHWCLHAPLCFR